MELTTAPFENFVKGKVAEYSNELLRTSTFFSRLGAGALTMDTLRYVFGQYRFWRDQFHTWFGVCILKSGSCASEEVSATVYALASHIASEMADDHAKIIETFSSISEFQRRKSIAHARPMQRSGTNVPSLMSLAPDPKILSIQ